MSEATTGIKLLRVTTVPISLQLLLRGQMKYMQEHGLKVIAVSADGPEVQKVVEAEGVEHHVIPFTRKINIVRDLHCLWLLIRLIKKEKPDIIHTHTPKAGLIGMVAGWICRTPKRYHTVAGMPLMEYNGLTRFILNFTEYITYFCAHRVFPNSNNLKRFIEQNFSFASKKLALIGHGSSNGIDLNYFSRTAIHADEHILLRQQLSIQKHDFVWLFVGRIVGDKGINELVNAFLKLQSTNKLHLVLVGSFEPELDQLNQNVLDIIETHPAIHLPGFQEDVRPWFLMADAFVFPSYREGFPNVILQAAAMNLPIIASDINGCNEIVVHNKNGWLVEPKNELALQNAMQQALDKPDLLSKFGQEIRSEVEQKFSQDKIWETIRMLYSNS